MEKLTDPNPYEILDISQDADRNTIKRALGKKQRTNKTQQERQQAAIARKTLFSIEKRLVVDALTPNFPDASEPQIKIKSSDMIDWKDVVNLDDVRQHDLDAFILATVKHNMRQVQDSEMIELINEFDDTDDFINNWLGSILNAAQVDAVSKLPTLDELRAQLAGLVISPAQGIVNVLYQATGGVVNVLQAYLDKNEEGDDE